jgi:hypothetical protein
MEAGRLFGEQENPAPDARQGSLCPLRFTVAAAGE